MKAPASPARVLYIDDDPGVGRLVAMALEGRGFVVDHATSGVRGLERLRRGGVDIVALDHFMPGENSFDVLKEIRALPDAPPLIYITASEDILLAIAALKAGAVNYVWKDVHGHFRELLCETVEIALEHERLRREKIAADVEILAARERAEALLHEVNHRVANSLQLVTSMIGMQLKAIEERPVDPRDALAETQSRIIAIAQVHRRLYNSANVKWVELSAYLAGLIEELGASMRDSGHAHSIRLDAAPLDVSADKAVAVGVIVNELVTNAYKYAYPDVPAGDIRVRLSIDADAVSLAVEDDGVGRRNGELKGFGLGDKIVKAMCATLGATLAVESTLRGTWVRIDFPNGN